MLAIRAGKHFRRALVAGFGAFTLVALAACGNSSGAGKKDTVTLLSPPWVGGEANVAVAKYILEKELGYKVTIKDTTQGDAWKALAAGKGDALLEDWGTFPQFVEKYVEKEESVVLGGNLGMVGRIGWYMPRYLADEDREVTRWENLNDYADAFETRDSGGKGVLFQGDPSYQSHDKAIIKNLDLNYELDYLGSEEAQLDMIRKRSEDERPFLTYWWTPHWIEDEVDLAEVRLPEHYKGCDANPKKVRCGYPEADLLKFLNADFAEDGGKAAEFLRNFEWGEEEQNAVAKMIAGDGLSRSGAAKKWADENEGIWKKWLWGLEDA